jgi:hypothetical protein
MVNKADVENPNQPGTTCRVDTATYADMRTALQATVGTAHLSWSRA